MKSQSLWSSTPAWRLPICKAPSPTSAWRLSIYEGALTSPCARQFIIPTRGSVCPPTSKVAISSLSGVSKETWLPLISPLEMHNAGGVFLRHSSPSSPTCSFIPTGSPSQLFSELDTYVFENDAIAVRADRPHLHADRRSTHINLKCARQHDHILHCRCTRRFIRGTPSPAPNLQCDVHWCTDSA